MPRRRDSGQDPDQEPQRCKARSKRTGERCKKPVVPGYTVCYYHGANPTNRGGAPKGSKNALKTGEYESILVDTLTPQERGLFNAIKVDKIAAIDEQIKLALIRERRMMQRIADLAQVDMTVVERVYTTPQVPVPDQPGEMAEGVLEPELKERSVGTLGQIQRIEEAITRVQSQIRQMLVDKHRIETGAPPDGDELDRLFANMRRSREALEKGGGGDAD